MTDSRLPKRLSVINEGFDGPGDCSYAELQAEAGCWKAQPAAVPGESAKGVL